METIREFFSDYLNWLTLPSFKFSDVLEILVLAFVIYHVIKWIRDTRAWALVKGLAVLLVFYLLAVLLELDVITWIVQNTISVGIIALVILFQPELRKALEDLGGRNLMPFSLPFDSSAEEKRFSDDTIEELVRASFEMGKARTGALIVIERNIRLTEYERTGIKVDALVTSQLLINIFEHNTPLHDGAVVMRGDRVVAATCYLPLSDNREISKELGTRHRAGMGISEVTDSLTIIVSEETGKVTLAEGGKLIRGVDQEKLREYLQVAQKKNPQAAQGKKLKLRKGKA